MMNQDQQKENAAREALTHVRSGMVIGLGTGSTFNHFLMLLAERIKAEGLNVKGVPTSLKTTRLAREAGIPLMELDEAETIDLAVDGTDVADEQFHLIKGGGGSLYREKMVLQEAGQRVILLEEDKFTTTISGPATVPVEVVPFGSTKTWTELTASGADCKYRLDGEVKFVTDNGNYIVDCTYHDIADIETLHRRIKLMHGVVETGIFIEMADALIIGKKDGGVDTHKRTLGL